MKDVPQLRSRLLAALKEDGAFTDITTRALRAPTARRVHARFICKRPGVFCGGFLIKPLFSLIERSVVVKNVARDGARVRAGQTLALLSGRAAAILAGERTALNLLCHLSGIATLTSAFAGAVRGTGAKILDTRKTTPLWRDVEKRAVRCGGGENHRFSLSDAVLVKDNHWQAAAKSGRSISELYGPGSTVRRSKKRPAFVAIEATTHAQVWEAIKARADIILLDNMPLNRLKESLVLIRAARRALGTEKPWVEVSGGIDVRRAAELARLGVDRISVGALTHSAPALDISLEVD